MREFIYYSRTAPTSGSLIRNDMMKAGRLDIAIHIVIAAFFLSHSIRDDVKLHLCFAGPPDPTKHLIFKPKLDGKTGVDKIHFTKKDIGGLIKRMLFKHKPGIKNEVYPGFWIEKKPILKIIEELKEQGRKIYILDPKGEDIRNVKIEKDPVFVLGDHLGLPAKELKRLKSLAKPVTIGKRTYFASHTVTIVHNELDRLEDSQTQ